MVSTLSTNGLQPAPEFPTKPYESVNSKVSARWASHPLYEHYAGSWNALAYRFHGALNSGAKLHQSLTTFGGSPAPLERSHQEQELFNFFSNGFSAFESTFYAAFTFGTFIDPKNFPLGSPKDQQRVSPPQVVDTYKRAFSSDAIISVFARLFVDPAYQQWREVRNVLTHRTAPGRIMYVSFGADDAPPTEWKLNNILFDGDLVPARLKELVRLVGELVVGLDDFLDSRK